MPDLSVGGQAVIEGVMMRSTDRVSTAVRRIDGSIVVKNEDFIPISKRNKVYGLPIVRGAISFLEMLFMIFTSFANPAQLSMKGFINFSKFMKEKMREVKFPL